MFKWKEEFSVNIEEIDRQHKELFRIGYSLYNIISIKDGLDRYDEIMEILKSLQDYAHYHFDWEENLMKEYNYPKYNEHKKEHNVFFKTVSSIKEEKIDEEQRKVGMDLIVFIANWIENHILKTDKQYKEFLNSKGVF